MTNSGDSTVEARVRAVEQDYQRRQARLFQTFALIEVPVLALLVVGIFVLKLVEPEIGAWILLAVAMLGGGILSMLIVQHARSRAAAIAQARGENPLF